MAFNLTLYDCEDDPRKLSKSLTGPKLVENVKPTGIVDLISPSFILGYDADYTTKNYCVVGPPFNRSYFITDMEIEIGKKIIISCAVDVLQTYQDGIKALTANVLRQENKIKEALPDPNFVYLNQHDVMSFLLPNYQNTIFGDQPAGQFNIVLGINGAPNSYAGKIEGYTLLTAEPSDWNLRYVYYWVNTGTLSDPAMISIGELVSRGTLPSGVSYNDVVAAYGGVYSKDMQ